MAADKNKKSSAIGGGSNVVAQAGILAAASILSRIIGLLYRSPLTAIIGDEGNGYYGTAINIYTIILMVSSFGVPSAISKQMAQKMAVGDYRNAQKVFHCSMVYALAVGILGSLLLFFGAGALVPPNSVPVLQVFAPTVFLFGILGVLRGYFQANQSMLQTSVSQILEQIANAVVSIGAAFLLMRTVAGQGATTEAIHGAMGSALGTGSGVLVALIFMTFVYWKHRGMFMARVKDDTEHEEAPFGPLMRETILVITPFILSSFILNLTTSVNQTIFMKIMIGMRGWEEVMTTTLYAGLGGSHDDNSLRPVFQQGGRHHKYPDLHSYSSGGGDPPQYLNFFRAGQHQGDPQAQRECHPHDADHRGSVRGRPDGACKACHNAPVPAVGYAGHGFASSG